jgi:hypothetical protein
MLDFNEAANRRVFIRRLTPTGRTPEIYVCDNEPGQTASIVWSQA